MKGQESLAQKPSYEADKDREFYRYQQEELNYSDPEGDLLLAQFRENFNNGDRLRKMLTGKLNELLALDRKKFSFYESELEYIENQNDVIISVESTHKPYSREELYETLASSIYQYELNSGHKVIAGKCHRWSSEFRNSDGYGRVKAMGKLLTALSLGVSSQYLKTGTEEELKNWLLRQKDRSVTLNSILLYSLEINRGDLYLASLTIENLLSRYWRAEKREDLIIIRKLASITSILNDNGDIFGSWYHLWGMITYGQCYGAVKSVLMGTLETIGSHFSYGFVPEPQQDHLNLIAGPVGKDLVKAIKDKKDLSQKENKIKIPQRAFGYLDTYIEGDSLFIKSLGSKMRFCHLLIHLFDEEGYEIGEDYFLYKTIYQKKHREFQIKNLSKAKKIHVTMDKCFLEKE